MKHYTIFFLLYVLFVCTAATSAKPQVKPLKVYLEQLPPYAFHNQIGQVEGVYVDLIDLIFQHSSKSYEIVLRDTLSRDSIGHYPCTILAQNRWTQLADSNTYFRLLFHANSALIHKKKHRIQRLSEICDFQIGVLDKTFFMNEMKSYGLFVPASHVHTFHSLEEAVQMLDDDTCDLIVTDYLLAYWFIEKNLLTDYSVEELMSLPSLYKIYLGDNYSQKFAAWLDQRISTMAMNGQIDHVFYTWFGHPHEYKVLHVKSRLTLMLVLLAFLTLVLLMAIYLVRKRTISQVRSFHEFQDILMGLPHAVDMYVNENPEPIFRNKQSVQLEEAFLADPDNVFYKEEYIRFVYKKNHIKIVMKMDVTELEQARQKANTSSYLKTQFLANTSHDLRSPLNAIVGFADLMSSCEDTEEMAEYAQIIEMNTNNLLHLIDEIIHLSQVQTEGIHKHKRAECDLYPILRRAVMEHELYLEKHNKKDHVSIILTTNFSKMVVLADSGRVHRVLVNLLSNACKYTDQGSVCVDVRYNEQAQTISLKVTDTGAGMSQEKVDNLFSGKDVHDYQRKDSFGLGLAICKAILDKGNGTIQVQSRQGVGTVVNVVYKPKVYSWEMIDVD